MTRVKMTRADKLRSVIADDEKLVEFIFEFGVDEQLEFCPGLPECVDGNATAEDCKRCMLQWLRSPAEGEEDKGAQGGGRGAEVIAGVYRNERKCGGE